MHGYDPIGKSGFTRHGSSAAQLSTVSLGELDAAVAAAIAAGDREAGAGPHAVDAAEHVDGQAVKVLGGGQVHHPLTVTATKFSASAIAKLEAAGGEAIEES
jgi:large subunit ribosomal protein L15